jgi:hypothetical protein
MIYAGIIISKALLVVENLMTQWSKASNLKHIRKVDGGRVNLDIILINIKTCNMKTQFKKKKNDKNSSLNYFLTIFL